MQSCKENSGMQLSTHSVDSLTVWVHKTYFTCRLLASKDLAEADMLHVLAGVTVSSSEKTELEKEECNKHCL